MEPSVAAGNPAAGRAVRGPKAQRRRRPRGARLKKAESNGPSAGRTTVSNGTEVLRTYDLCAAIARSHPCTYLLPEQVSRTVCNPSVGGDVYPGTKGARTGEPRRRGAFPRIRHRAIRRSALARLPDVRGLARRGGCGSRVPGQAVRAVEEGGHPAGVRAAGDRARAGRREPSAVAAARAVGGVRPAGAARPRPRRSGRRAAADPRCARPHGTRPARRAGTAVLRGIER